MIPKVEEVEEAEGTAGRPLHVHTAAKLLRLSPRMVRHLAAAGLLPARKRGPKIWEVERQPVLELARQREVRRDQCA